MQARYTPQRIEIIRKNGPFFYLKPQIPHTIDETSEVRLWQSVLNWALADYLANIPIDKDDPEAETSSWEEYLSEDNYHFGVVCDRARFSVPFALSVFQKMKKENPYTKKQKKQIMKPTGKATMANSNTSSLSTTQYR